jgi:hypothetical protein
VEENCFKFGDRQKILRFANFMSNDEASCCEPQESVCTSNKNHGNYIHYHLLFLSVFTQNDNKYHFEKEDIQFEIEGIYQTMPTKISFL